MFLVEEKKKQTAGGDGLENEAADGVKTKWILDEEERLCGFEKGKHAHPQMMRLESRMYYLFLLSRL